jgi:tetratricopeptide (TPR) repeat protein
MTNEGCVVAVAANFNFWVKEQIFSPKRHFNVQKYICLRPEHPERPRHHPYVTASTMKRPQLPRFTGEQVRAGLQKVRPMSRLDYFVQNHVKLFTFCIGLLILWRFVAECQNENYTVVPVTVPEALTKKGYNSSAVTNKIFDDIHKITDLNPSASSRGAVLLNLMGFNQTDIVRLEDNYEGGTFDLSSLFKAAKSVVNIEDRAVVSHIVETEDDAGQKGLAMFIKINNKSIPTLSVSKVSMVDSLLSMAASKIVQYTQPKFLARKLIADHRKEEALAVLQFSKRRSYTHDAEEEAEDQRAGNQIQLAANDIYFLLYEAGAGPADDPNRYIKQCDSARQLCYKLRGRFPRDISSYVLEISILKSQALHVNDYIDPNSPEIVKLCNDGIRVFKGFEKVWFKRSDYFDENRAKGIMYTSYAYFLSKAGQASDEEVLDIFNQAINFLPDNAHVYNDLIYFYVGNKEYDKADSMAKYILERYPTDNNLWDTRAEINYYSDNLPIFYYCLRRAVSPPDPALGFTPEAYLKDLRWQHLLQTKEYRHAVGFTDGKNVQPMPR